MDAFYNFTMKIVDSNNEQYKEQYKDREGERKEFTNNAMGMVAVKLMNDESIQNDNITIDRLQKRIRSFETTSPNGKSIQTL